MRRFLLLLPLLAVLLWSQPTASAPVALYPAPAPMNDYLRVPRPQYIPTAPDLPGVPEEYRRLVVETAGTYELDPTLLAAMVDVESDWDVAATGSAGERGLLQIMPATAREIAEGLGMVEYDLTDPGTNLEMAAWYLRSLIDTEGDEDAALASYNAGPRWREKAPVAARGYVDRVREAQRR